ncbi:unnamed protein product [Cochlearia groenlandica]
MSTSRRTIIRFDYGGYYTNKVDGSSLSNLQETNKMYVVLFNMSKKKVTYAELVYKIRSKMEVVPTSKLLISYISHAVYPSTTSYIVDDEYVYVYLIEGSRTIVLHVEVSKRNEQVRFEEDGSRYEATTKIVITQSVDFVPTILSPMDGRVDEPIDNHNNVFDELLLCNDVEFQEARVASNGEKDVFDELLVCNDFEVQGSQVANNGENDVFDELLECNDVEFQEARVASNGEEDENIDRSWEDGLQFAIDQ